MGFKVLSPAAAMKALELAGKSYRPKEIVELKEAIENKTRLAELRASLTGTIDQELIHEIVAMKLELDRLYGEWAERECGDSALLP